MDDKNLKKRLSDGALISSKKFDIQDRNPLNCRQTPKFSEYFNILWKELGVDE